MIVNAHAQASGTSHASPRTAGASLLVLLALASPAVAVEPKVVSFNAADGVRITADYYPPSAAEGGAAPLVILVHMESSDRHGWEPFITPLHKTGFAVLAPDFRGHGDSATTATREQVHAGDRQLFLDMQHDLRGAYDWLARQPKVDRARFALVGAGVGASVALQYAAQDRSVDAIVCLSPAISPMGLDTAGDLRQIRGRKILMLATEDERDGPYTLKTRTEGIRVQIFKNVEAHGTDMFGHVDGLERGIVRFLALGVGEHAATPVYGSINSHIYHTADSGWLERISATNLRHYSSSAEAEARGLRAARSKSPPKSTRENDRNRRDGRAAGR